MSNVLEKHPTFEKIFEFRRQVIFQNLAYFINPKARHNLSFWPYVSKYPTQFYSRRVAKLSFDFLTDIFNTDKEQVVNILQETLLDLELAFRILDEINPQKENDELLSDSHESKVRFIDEFINYNYLRLTEGVLGRFLKPFAIHLRSLRQAKLEGMDIYQMVEELKRSKLSDMVHGYDNIIRNGIAHSHITYRNQDIIYRDSKGKSKSVSILQMVNLYDELLDICNGLALSLQAFLLTHENFIKSKALVLPRSLIFRIAAEELNTPFWAISMVMDNTTFDDRTQLLVFVQNKLISDIAARFYVFRTFYHVQKILPNFDRYFLSLDSKYSNPRSGWSILNGIKYRQLLGNGLSPEEAIGQSIEDEIIFFISRFPFSRLFAKFHAWGSVYSTHWGQFRKEVILKKEGLNIDFRVVRYHRSRWSMTFKAEVVIDCDGNIRDEVVKNYKRILRKTRKYIRCQIPRFSVWRYLPVSLYVIHVFNQNFRKRTLVSNGLIPELVGRLLVKKRKNVKIPDLPGSEVLEIGHLRINWNKNHVI